MNEINFNDTEVAFKSKSDAELRKTARIYSLLNKKWLLKMGSILDYTTLPLKIPFIKPIIKSTIFKIFVGGEDLPEAKPTVSQLDKQQVKSVLDYGKEAKQSNEDFDNSVKDLKRTIDFSEDNNEVPVISLKITALMAFDLMQKIQENKPLTQEEEKDYRLALQRLETLGQYAEDAGVSVFIDAEESWIQDTIDEMVFRLMRRHNKNRVIIYNTIQMYRKDRLEFLDKSIEDAEEHDYVLGVKLVRGAYMVKEAKRAKKYNYPNPIHYTKEDVDRDFNEALVHCVEHPNKISLCVASHNEYSCQLLTQLMQEYNIEKNNYHFSFCQLYGMSDNITFKLAEEGYNTAKYVPYGSVENVIPYLVRRAQENASMTGSMDRERSLILKEIKRREQEE